MADLYESLETCFEMISPGKAIVDNCHTDFKWGQQSPEDNTHPGQPVSAFTLENISAVEQIITENPQAQFERCKMSWAFEALQLITPYTNI